ncbi:MAG: 3-phosphoshikimate 1-carboxyvinyltransferase [Angelakisella sp.]|nr:3-phosphoshikimate 1-carboxyvinyltransferase [Angelakisella sp.]
MEVTVCPTKLSGTVDAPVSKSAAHRAFICAALANAPVKLHLPQTNDDIEATMGCLTALGAQFIRNETHLCVRPVWGHLPKAPPVLDCGESGSTLRFLLPVAAALGGADFVVHGRLGQRPLSPLRRVLEAHGCTLSLEGHWPLQVRGSLCGGEYALPGDVSSQYFSGLLLALPLVKEQCRLRYTTPLESAPYTEMTRLAMAQFGVTTVPQADGWVLPAGQQYTVPQGVVSVEGDWSAAAFWLVAGALGGTVTVRGVNAHSPQGDRAVVPLLSQMGAEMTYGQNSVTVRQSRLTALQVDFSQIPDLLPILAVAAVFAEGVSRFYGAQRLRDKESNRLAAMTQCLNALGAAVEETADGLVIQGKPALIGGLVDSWGDHRIAMSMAVAALRCTHPVTITGGEAVSKSYPGFYQDFKKLGGGVVGG